MSYLASLLLFITIVLQLGACGGGGGGGANSDTSPAATLQTVQLSLAADNLVEGLTTQAQVAAIYSDNSSRDLSSQAQWNSLDPSVASIDGNGTITAGQPGDTTISAVVDGKLVTAPLTVTQADLAALEITPADPALAAALQQQFNATGIYYNGATHITHDVTGQVSWSSSDSDVLSISNTTGSKGLATSIAAGTATLGVTLDGVSATTAVTVNNAALTRIEISAPQTTLPVGSELQLTATGIYADNSRQDLTRQVNWSSADTAIATIDADGLVSAVAAGTVTLSLSHAGQSATQVVEVSGATLSRIELSPPDPTLAAGDTLQLTATAIYSDASRLDVTAAATWSSADASIAAVGNTTATKGRVDAATQGSTTITAHFESQSTVANVTVSAATLQSLSLSPINPDIAAGTQQTFSVTGHYSDGSTRDLSEQAQWLSSTTTVATVLESAGTFEGVGAGTSRITAEVGDRVAFTDLNVTPATLDSISLSPANLTLAAGNTTQLSATGHFSDGSSQDLTATVTWSSSDTALAEVGNAGDNSGMLNALAAGTVTVTADMPGSAVTQSSAVTLTDATLDSLTIQLAASSMNVGGRQAATATAHFSDGSTLDVTEAVTWSSSAGDVADIGNAANLKGRVTGLSAGTTSLTATLDGVAASTGLTVVNNPNAPAALSLAATPNVILNDDSDSSSVGFTVLPSDAGGAIADGTTIDVEINAGGSTTQRTLTTTDGGAAFELTTDYAGFVTITATLAGTNISADGFVYATPGFADVVARTGYQNVQYDAGGTTLLQGSEFRFVVKNLSNRSFNIEQYEFKIGALSNTTENGAAISGGDLSSGEQYSIIVGLPQDYLDNGVVGIMSLSDPGTGRQFDADYTFTTP